MKIMSLAQNIWERPLIRELRHWQDRIAALEHEMRDLWGPDDSPAMRHAQGHYKDMDKLTVLLSDANRARFEVMKQLNEGRRHDE